MLLQNRAAVTNWGKMYYKLEQVLQISAIITNWGITPLTYYSQLILDFVFFDTLNLLFHNLFCTYINLPGLYIYYK